MSLALWIAIGAAIICTVVAIYFGTKKKNKSQFIKQNEVKGDGRHKVFEPQRTIIISIGKMLPHLGVASFYII